MNTKLDENFFQQLLLQAGESPRKRSHHNLHKELTEPVQRLCIALKKGSYVRPHHHPENNRWELMLVLKGTVNLIIFNSDGEIKEKLSLSRGDSLCGIEVEANTWHTIYPSTEDAIMLEVKEGPYTPTEESDFAAWAPAEGDDRVTAFLDWLEAASPGDSYHAA